ncbi:MAG TPA: alkaline phosphatase family protein [Gemmatimonadaceae bacterium]|nr:alkaline phosphatase family protein [Gemmatimonadaceae bacterium]
MGPVLRWYYSLKFSAFRRERRPRDERRGLVALQIDALAYSDLRRALELGYCPTIARLLNDEGFHLRRWFSGLPSATPYCQAGIFHGENDEIPAFRFYDRRARRIITCNAPEGVQYIRDRIHAPGVLAGGSSYVNLLDGDAETVAFTIATREHSSIFRRLGGFRMAVLILVHPIRVLRMGVQSIAEWLREEYERLRHELAGKATHAEGIFPFLRVFTNVVVRELQTMAIMLDIYLGIPIIYSTFMQYDEMGHHFGPSSRVSLADLRRTDARIGEIWRMIRAVSSRPYDLVILSDHGMTPASSYRVRFGESLGTTVQRILEGDARQAGITPLSSLMSVAPPGEYVDVAAQIVDEAAAATDARHVRTGRVLRRVRDWLRSRYGVRELVWPEKYWMSERHDVVVTFSSSLAHVYFADALDPLSLPHIARDRRRTHLYTSLLVHPGIGILCTRLKDGVHVESRSGRALITGEQLEVLEGANPLERYGVEPCVLRAIAALVRQPNAGDIVIFGAYDGYDIVSFDDQIGAHGSAGGDQVWPFLVTPPEVEVSNERIEDARDIHRVVMTRWARQHTDRESRIEEGQNEAIRA